jgi:quinol monooxygenase YgiN
MKTDAVTVVISCRAQPGQESTARQEFMALITTVLSQEPACLGITLHEHADDPGRLLLYEHWSSRAEYEGPHLQTSYLRSFIERSGAFLAGPPDIAFWHRVD